MATKRGYYREELRRSMDNLEMALTHLARFVQAYEKDYPEIARTVQAAGDVIVKVAETLTEVHDAI